MADYDNPLQNDPFRGDDTEARKLYVERPDLSDVLPSRQSMQEVPQGIVGLEVAPVGPYDNRVAQLSKYMIDGYVTVDNFPMN